MSKPNSGHFSGTSGIRNMSKNLSQNNNQNATITTESFDTREHPSKYKQMSSKKLKLLREKEAKRILTKSEYKHKEWQRRLTTRRNQAIKEFWEKEAFLIKNKLPTTRNWNAAQRHDILAGKRPKFKNKPMSSHHTYSVAKYPHLANRRELIFPVTYNEHIYGWHGGNPKNSLPGKPIKQISEF